MIFIIESFLYVFSFTLQLTSGACQIVSLGAGFDTYYWILKDQGLSPQTYIEMDFAAVTSRKIHFIRRSKPLLDKIANDGWYTIYFTSPHSHSLTLSKTTNFRLFQTARLCRRQFQV